MTLDPYAKLASPNAAGPTIVRHEPFKSTNWPDDIPKSPKLSKGRIGGRWLYTDASGVPVLAVYRVNTTTPEGQPQKRFVQFDCEQHQFKSPIDRPLYRLDVLRAHDGPVVVVEGEKSADTLLDLGIVATTTPGGSGATNSAQIQSLRGRTVVIWPDHDEPGRKYRDSLTSRLQELGAQVWWVEPPSGVPAGWDVYDAISGGWTPSRVVGLLQSAEAADLSSAESVYFEDRRGIFTRQGNKNRQLTNFRAHIVGERIRKSPTGEYIEFEIRLQYADNSAACRVIPAARFRAMDWVESLFGARALVYSGYANRDQTRVAIMELSKHIPKTVVHEQIGFHQINGQWKYLHAGGAIGTSQTDTVVVDPPAQLAGFSLPSPPNGTELTRCIRSSLAVASVVPPKLGILVLAAVYRAVRGRVDFGIWLMGLTGAGKTAVAALAQQHFGASMARDNLPGSWSSTGNALEALACRAKDALFVVDDFVRAGGRREIASLNNAAERLIRGQDNRAGRSRLSQTATIQDANRPEGLVLGTGEDAPTGQSLRARLLILELDPADLNLRRLTTSQREAEQGLLAGAVAAFAQHLANDYEAAQARFRASVERCRPKYIGNAGHRRSAFIAAELRAAFESWAEFCVVDGGIPRTEMDLYVAQLVDGLDDALQSQLLYQTTANPGEHFLRNLVSALASGRAHIASLNGGEPRHAPSLGWRIENGRLQAFGDRVGWTDGESLYLDCPAAMKVAKTADSASVEALEVTSRALGSSLRESGLLVSTGCRSGAQRFKARKTIQGRRHDVLHLRLGSVLDVAQMTHDAPHCDNNPPEGC